MLCSLSSACRLPPAACSLPPAAWCRCRCRCLLHSAHCTQRLEPDVQGPPAPTDIDRVLYRGAVGGLEAAEAEDLWQRLKAMCGALGLCLLTEQPPKEYIKRRLHRSTSGAVLNGLRVPSVTIECGGHGVAEPSARDGVTAGLHNLLRHIGMQAGEIVPQTSVAVGGKGGVDLQNLHRTISFPHMPCTGVAGECTSFSFSAFPCNSTVLITVLFYLPFLTKLLRSQISWSQPASRSKPAR